MDKRLYLKIKLKSLAAEAAIIRREENKLKRAHHGEETYGLTYHRKYVVRKEARYTGLAYGFLRGLPYSKIEIEPKREPDWKYVKSMVQRYGDATGFDEWVKAGAATFLENPALVAQ